MIDESTPKRGLFSTFDSTGEFISLERNPEAVADHRQLTGAEAIAARKSMPPELRLALEDARRNDSGPFNFEDEKARAAEWLQSKSRPPMAMAIRAEHPKPTEAFFFLCDRREWLPCLRIFIEAKREFPITVTTGFVAAHHLRNFPIKLYPYESLRQVWVGAVRKHILSAVVEALHPDWGQLENTFYPINDRSPAHPAIDLKRLLVTAFYYHWNEEEPSLAAQVAELEELGIRVKDDDQNFGNFKTRLRIEIVPDPAPGIVAAS